MVIIYCYKPIGYVKRGIPRDKGESTKSRYEYVSVIEVLDEYVDGLDGLEEFSHIIVIWAMHRRREVKLRVRPHGDIEAPLVGVFASRSPSRPNKIGLTIVKLDRVDGNKLYVRGLDAWTGTPILDIKPYDYYDIVRDPRVPEWFKMYWGKRAKMYSEVAPWLGPC